MSLLELYFITMLPKLSEFSATMAVISVVALFLGALLSTTIIDGSRDEDVAKRHVIAYFKKCALGLFFSAFLAIVLPSERQLAMIAGGYIATNTEGVKGLPDNLVKAANEFLESYYEKGDGKATKP